MEYKVYKLKEKNEGSVYFELIIYKNRKKESKIRMLLEMNKVEPMTVSTEQQPPIDLIDKNQQEVDQLQHILKENITKVVERGCQLDQLNLSCENLQIEANQFQTNAAKVKHHFKWKNKKWKIIFVISTILLLLVFITVAIVFIIRKFVLKI